MKKAFIALMLCISLLLLCACGDVSDVKVLPYESEMYTDAEIEEAIDVTKDYFKKHFDGCKLLEITYAGDERTTAEKEFASRHNADELIVLLSSYYVSPTGGDGSLNQDSTYDGWCWILVRNNGGKWRHVDHGY